MESEDKEARRPAHRKGDQGGHITSPAKAISGSPNIFINGKPAMRMGDIYEDETRLIDGSATVFFNGKPAGRIGDAINNGGIALTGSADVFIGEREGASFSSSCSQAHHQAQAQMEEILAAEPPRIYPEGGINTNRERNMINRYLRRNRLISKAYADLYQDMPDNRWAGIAAIVSSQMGCNMWLLARKYDDLILKTFAPHPTYVMFPDWIEALGEGNRAIFKAMYPPLRMAADRGYDQFLKCYDAGAFSEKEVPKAMAEAIRLLKDGKLKDAAERLVDYEQKEVARPIYEKYAAAFKSLDYVADIGTKLGIDFKSLPLSRRCGSKENIIPFTKDLTNEDDRINYFWDLYDHWDGVLD